MTFTIGSLNAGSNYEIRIAAINAAGESSPSDSIQVIAAKIPEQPLPVTKLFSGLDFITFRW
jgi:hypothetical protein